MSDQPEYDRHSNILLQRVTPARRRYQTAAGEAAAVCYDQALEAPQSRFVELLAEFQPAGESRQRSLHVVFDLLETGESGLPRPRGVFEIVPSEELTLSNGFLRLRDVGWAVNPETKQILVRHERLEGTWLIRCWIGNREDAENELAGWPNQNDSLQRQTDWKPNEGHAW